MSFIGRTSETKRSKLCRPLIIVNPSKTKQTKLVREIFFHSLVIFCGLLSPGLKCVGSVQRKADVGASWLVEL